MTSMRKDWAVLGLGTVIMTAGLLSLIGTLKDASGRLAKLERQQKDIAELMLLQERGATAKDSRIKSLLSQVTVVSEINPLVENELGDEARMTALADQVPEPGWVLRKVRIDWAGSDWKKMMDFMTKAESELRPAWRTAELDLQTENHAGGRVQLTLQQLYKTGDNLVP